MDPQDPLPPEEDMSIRTRSGYAVPDAVRSFKVALEQGGATAAGKSIHYSADIICSGCFELWQKLLYEFALDHVGIASPRIFHFLNLRFTDLNAAWGKLPAEQFYRTLDYQKAIAECILVLRSCPRKPPLKMPRVPPEAHNDEWVRGAVQGAPSSACIGRVFRTGQDLPVLRRVGDEFARAISDGATEKAFFWLKWLIEEDVRLKKDNGGTLSGVERGPIAWPSKTRSHIGFFIAQIVAELYKELSTKGLIRMNEEFTAILNLYLYPRKVLTQKRRQDLLCLAIQILCEVPRWKSPAATTLVKDPVALGRALGHAESFFREILAFEAPSGDVTKEAKKSATTKPLAIKNKDPKKLKQMSVDEHLAAYDEMIDKWMIGKL